MSPANYQPSRLVEALTLGRNNPNAQVLSPRQSEVLGRIIACGSGRLGAHIRQCLDCGHARVVAHSCRDRHCPRCQRRQAELWLERQKAALLPIPYFHLVFTLPHELNPIIRQNRRVCLNLLFRAACSTLMDFGHNNLAAQIGLSAILHTWGQSLCEHYHLHIIVTGGGLSLSGDEWIESESEKWIFPTRALAKVYQARYLEGLRNLYSKKELEFHGKIEHWSEPDRFNARLRTSARRRWNVYAKAPFAGPEQVLEYLALYTHRVAISQKRVREVDAEAGTVRFRYKDYGDKGKWKPMTLSAEEFTRRFAQHILPRGFCKIRHWGILSNGNRRDRIALCRVYLEGTPLWPRNRGETAETPSESDTGTCPAQCDRCGSTRLRWISGPVFAVPSSTAGTQAGPAPLLIITKARAPT